MQELYNKLKHILRWNYPGMEGYVQDIWILLAGQSSVYCIKNQVITYNKELGMGPSEENAELYNIIQELIQLRPFIQKYSKLAMKEKKIPYEEMKRLKKIEDELNEGLKLLEQDDE